MTEIKTPGAYWANYAGSAPESWQVKLLQHCEGQLEFRVFSSFTKALENIDFAGPKTLVTYEDPGIQISESIRNGSSLPEALADWSSQTDDLLQLKQNAPNKIFLAANSLVRHDPNTVFNALDLDATPCRPIDGSIDPRSQSREFGLATLSLRFEPWAGTLSRLMMLSVAHPPVSHQSNEIESLEEIWIRGERETLLLKNCLELKEQNSSLLKQLHGKEEALISAVRSSLSSDSTSRSNQDAMSRQSKQLRVAEEQVQVLRAELEKERGRIVKFKTKIRQLRQLLHDATLPPGPGGATPSRADNAKG